MTPQLPHRSYSVPAIGGGDVTVQGEVDHVLLVIDLGPSKDGMMAALTVRDAVRLVHHILDVSDAIQ